MKVCQAFKNARTKWQEEYDELNRHCEAAENAEQWERVERLGDRLVAMEEHSGFRKCLHCGKRGCPARLDGSWEADK